MSDDQQPNRDHRCRTCEHWGAPYITNPSHDWQCMIQLPFFAEEPGTRKRLVVGHEGENCKTYLYSYRRARLVR